MSLRAPPARLKRKEADHRQDGDRHGRGTAADDRASGGVSQSNFRGGDHGVGAWPVRLTTSVTNTSAACWQGLTVRRATNANTVRCCPTYNATTVMPDRNSIAKSRAGPSTVSHRPRCSGASVPRPRPSRARARLAVWNCGLRESLWPRHLETGRWEQEPGVHATSPWTRGHVDTSISARSPGRRPHRHHGAKFTARLTRAPRMQFSTMRRMKPVSRSLAPL